MIQIQPKTYTTGTATLLQVINYTNSEGGSVWYKIFDTNHNLVTEGNLPVDAEFISTFDGTEIAMGNLIAEYLGLTIF
jgi:hypothetical protein